MPFIPAKITSLLTGQSDLNDSMFNVGRRFVTYNSPFETVNEHAPKAIDKMMLHALNVPVGCYNVEDNNDPFDPFALLSDAKDIELIHQLQFSPRIGDLYNVRYALIKTFHEGEEYGALIRLDQCYPVNSGMKRSSNAAGAHDIDITIIPDMTASEQSLIIDGLAISCFKEAIGNNVNHETIKDLSQSLLSDDHYSSRVKQAIYNYYLSDFLTPNVFDYLLEGNVAPKLKEGTRSLRYHLDDNGLSFTVNTDLGELQLNGLNKLSPYVDVDSFATYINKQRLQTGAQSGELHHDAAARVITPKI